MKRARRLRREQTVAERLLWAALRELNLKFRRQVPIGPYVADFAHHASKLVVEIDGYYHTTVEGQQRDLIRDAWLKARGYRVLHFPEQRVQEYPDVIVTEIEAAVGEQS